jgi:hypothetical protein
MNVISIKFPIDQIAAGIKATREAKAQLVSIDENLHKYGTEDEARKYRGEDGVQERARELEKGDQQKTAIIAETREKLDKLHAQAVNFIEEQTTPDGTDIIGDNAGDFALIEHGLIETPEKLERVLAKHDNVAFRYAAQRYAADPARNWPGFNFFENEAAIKEYTAQIFDCLNDAAGNPYGAAVMQYTETPTEYARIAEAYGLKESFIASGGDRLKEV